MSVPVHNDEDFHPGDEIVICDQGGTYRDQLEPPSSGSAGNPIIYVSEIEGSPTISAFDPAPDWSRVWEGGRPRANLYKAPVPVHPKMVLVDSRIGMEETVQESLDSPNEWFWEERRGIGTLYVFGPNPPHNVRMTTREHAMLAAGREFLVFQGITFEGGRSPYGSAYLDKDCGHIIIRNCSFQYAFANGLRMNGTGSGLSNSVTNCSFTFNGNDGAYFAQNKYLDFSYNNAVGNGWGAKGDRQAAGFWNCSAVDMHHNTLAHSGAGDCLEFTGSDFDLVSGEIHRNTFINQYGGSKQTVEIGRGAIVFHHNLILSHPKAIGIYTGSRASYRTRALIKNNKVINAGKSFSLYDDGSVHPETLIEIRRNISCNPALYHIHVYSKIIGQTESDDNFFNDDGGKRFAVGRTGYTFQEWKARFAKDSRSAVNSADFCDSQGASTYGSTSKEPSH
jgi:hypothetical protein